MMRCGETLLLVRAPHDASPMSNFVPLSLGEDHHLSGVSSSLSPARAIEERVLTLLHSTPGISVLADLVAIDPLCLDRAGRIDFLSALEKQTAWLQAILNSAVIAVAGDEADAATSIFGGVDDAQREEVAAALRLSGGTAQLRIDVARTLTQHLPVTCSALANGDISSAHATVIARESAELIRQGATTEQINSLENQAIAHAEFHTPAQLAKKVKSVIAKIAPEEFAAAVESAVAGRRVDLYPGSNGLSTVVAILPAADAQTLFLAIDKIARNSRALIKSRLHSEDKHGGNPQDQSQAESQAQFQGYGLLVADRQNPSLATSKTVNESVYPDGTETIYLDQLRADALTQLAAKYLAESSDHNLEHRRPVSVNITLDLPTLLGMAENPGLLAGYGAIPASIARELASDGKWKRFITDPVTGNLLDYGRQSYTPPQALVDFILARDRICRFPGCRQSARFADIDHAIPWESGGHTSPENLGALCRRHHRLKTHGGWLLNSFPDGSCEWISPAGKKYFVPARPIDEVA